MRSIDFTASIVRRDCRHQQVWDQQRQGDGEECLDRRRAIDLRGLEQLLRDGRHATQQDQRHQRRPLPGFDPDQRRQHRPLRVDPLGRADADHRQQVVQHARLWVQHHHPHQRNRNGRRQHREREREPQRLPPREVAHEHQRRPEPQHERPGDRPERVEQRPPHSLAEARVAREGRHSSECPRSPAHPVNRHSKNDSPAVNTHGTNRMTPIVPSAGTASHSTCPRGFSIRRARSHRARVGTPRWPARARPWRPPPPARSTRRCRTCRGTP